MLSKSWCRYCSYNSLPAKLQENLSTVKIWALNSSLWPVELAATKAGVEIILSQHHFTVAVKSSDHLQQHIRQHQWPCKWENVEAWVIMSNRAKVKHFTTYNLPISDLSNRLMMMRNGLRYSIRLSGLASISFCFRIFTRAYEENIKYELILTMHAQNFEQFEWVCSLLYLHQ